MIESIRGNTELEPLTLREMTDINGNEAWKPEAPSFIPGKHQAEK